MACKNSQPTRKCGDYIHIDRKSYSAAGYAVCYELEFRDGHKVAIKVLPSKRACNKFRKGARLNIAN